MSNMSYCRFENTYRDLCDCEGELQEMVNGANEEKLSKSELRYAKELVRTAVRIALLLANEGGLELAGNTDEDEIADVLDDLNVEPEVWAWHANGRDEATGFTTKLQAKVWGKMKGSKNGEAQRHDN